MGPLHVHGRHGRGVSKGAEALLQPLHVEAELGERAHHVGLVVLEGGRVVAAQPHAALERHERAVVGAKEPVERRTQLTGIYNDNEN